MTPTSDALCRLCGQAASRPLLTLRGMPRWNHRLLRREELATDAPVDLPIHGCARCGFVSLPMMLDDAYYSDYVNAPSTSVHLHAFLRQQAQEFVERFGLQGRPVLEVGCGDGGFLAELKDAGAIAFGIEPSAEQRKIATARGLRVESGILAPGRVIEGGPFDAFCTRQVFEHVEDMHGFLAAIREQLAPQGVGLVEVPNLDILLDQDRFFDFIPEHVNYFSPTTLRLVLELAGFAVLAVDAVQDGEALRALVQRRESRALDGLAARVDRLRADIAAFVQQQHDKGARVAVWGAGGKGLSMLAVSDLRHVDLLVDGDPHKHGRYTPVSHLEVASPDALDAQEVGAVVLMAPAYRKEILEQLRSRYGFTGPVGVVGARFEVIEPTAPAAHTRNPAR